MHGLRKSKHILKKWVFISMGIRPVDMSALECSWWDISYCSFLFKIPLWKHLRRWSYCIFPWLVLEGVYVQQQSVLNNSYQFRTHLYAQDSATHWRSNQSIPKEISPKYSLEGLMLKLKLQIFWLPGAKNWLTGKDPDAGKDWRQEEERMTEDELVGWHHRLNGHEFKQVPGVGDRQGSLACCSPWGCKESDMTEWLNWNDCYT